MVIHRHKLQPIHRLAQLRLRQTRAALNRRRRQAMNQRRRGRRGLAIYKTLRVSRQCPWNENLRVGFYNLNTAGWGVESGCPLFLLTENLERHLLAGGKMDIRVLSWPESSNCGQPPKQMGLDLSAALLDLLGFFSLFLVCFLGITSHWCG